MVDRLKAEQSISHYRTRLEMGAEPETRAVLLKQLLAEEKDLGRTREQLARIDRDIEKLQRTIAQHQKHIKRFKLVGADTEKGDTDAIDP